MIDIHFIVNPIAGQGRNNFSESFLQDYFEADKYSITIKSSIYKGHALVLSKESIFQKATIIVACGGDGTINEVASTLVGTSIQLGVIPIGSGNGLASTLNIPRNIHKALLLIKKNNKIRIDVGQINQRYFFSNTGFSFSASVIKNYEEQNKRTLSSYVTATFKSLFYYSKKNKLNIRINDKTDVTDPFLVFVSNSNTLGYDMSLTPKASLQDGLLDIVIVPKISVLKMLYFGLCLLLKKPNLLKEAICYQSDSLTLYRTQGAFYLSQIDGESSQINEETLLISIQRKALNVLV